MEVLKAKSGSFFSNLIWKFAERFLAQIISTVISIILARLLLPEDYGVVAIVMIFINLANVFVSDGLGSALIQKKDATSLDFFSVLYFNIVFSILLYLVLFFTAPLITKFYGSGYEILTPILRVLGIRIVFTSINSVQQAYISKKMIFKKFFMSTLLGTILSAFVGIVVAYKGFGAWALVAQYLTNTTVSTLVLFVVLKKRPRLIFSFKSIKELFPYGMYILLTGLLITGYQDLRALIIGKMYSKADLAYYDKAKHFPSLVVTNINTSISAVLFPKMSNAQDNIETVRKHTRDSVRLSSYIMFPMLMGLAAVAKPFIQVLLTDKWLECVPLLQLFCLVYLFQPIHTANMQAIKAIGYGNVYMRLEIIKKFLEFVALLIALPFGINAVAISMVICSIIAIILNAYPNIRFLNYGIKEQILDVLPNLLLSCIVFITTYALNVLPVKCEQLLLMQVFVGVLIYIVFSIFTKNKSFIRLLEILKTYVSKK